MSAGALDAECLVCGASREPAEFSRINSNVARFSRESFDVWRCGACDSIHAAQDVDLGAYYAAYPVHDVPLDWRTRPMYDNLRFRLSRAGLKREHGILDYGCGSGTFVEFLRQSKYRDSHGYDAYAEPFRDSSLLSRRWDCVVTQDVIEHVPDPLGMMRELDRLVRPGGLVAIGTPDAAGIDLRRPAAYVHALHQPYHRHIFSARALRAAGEKLGWTVVRHYRTMYVNTPWPFINARFVQLYMWAGGNTLDAALAPPNPKLLLILPWTLLVGLFGSLFPTRSEMMTIFRTSF